MKVIFLDMDGVMNTLTTSRIKWPDDIDGDLFDRLVKVINETDAFVVISSSWRYSPSCFLKILSRFDSEDLKARVIGITPKDMGGCPRSDEIKMWLDNHGPVEKFAIIDDDDDAGIDMEDSFFLTNPATGLTEEIKSRILNHLK
jgi:hypothetical protein